MIPEAVVAVFGWMSLLNAAILVLAWAVITFARDAYLGLAQRFLKMPKDEIESLYVNWVAQFKVFALIFSIVPYIAMRIVG